jgi:hypothetical protein
MGETGYTPYVGLMAEYSALREEIITRVKIRIQLLTFTIAALGVLITLTFGIQPLTSVRLPAAPVLASMSVQPGTGIVVGTEAYEIEVIYQDSPVWPLIAYPILSFLLSLVWMNNDVRIGELGTYIREYIEPELKIGWQTHYQSKRLRRPTLRRTAINAYLVFGGTQVVAILLAYDRLRPTIMLAQAIWLAVDVGLCLLTFAVVSARQRQRRADQQGE